MDTTAKVLNEIQEIFRKELDSPSLELSLNSSANDVEKWDSINNLILLTSIEERFDIIFPVEVILNAKNVGDLCKYVVEHSQSI